MQSIILYLDMKISVTTKVEIELSPNLPKGLCLRSTLEHIFISGIFLKLLNIIKEISLDNIPTMTKDEIMIIISGMCINYYKNISEEKISRLMTSQ